MPLPSFKLVFAAAFAALSTPSLAQEFAFDIAADFRGALIPVQKTTLASGLNGRIDEVLTDIGKVVEKGAPLVRLDCRVLAAEKRIAEAARTLAETRLKTSEDLARSDNISLVDLQSARSELARSIADQERAEAELSYCVIKAPFSGVVTQKLVDAFQHVQVGQPLLELVDNSAFTVDFAVSSTVLRDKVEGRPFEITLDETGNSYKGIVERSSGAVDPISQTVRLIGRLTDPTSDLIAGMSGTITLTTD